MAFTTTIDLTDYINRGVEILKANPLLRDTGTPSDSLVTDVIAQQPPIEQSPDTTIIPVIYVYYSRNPIGQIENIGRDGLDAAGAKYYHIEFYNVCVARGINKRVAQQKVQLLSKIIRDEYQKNLRLTDPAVPGTDPLALTNEVIAVPYVLRSEDPNIQAINVICRPKVPVSLR
jgi:hypothetical protein